MSSSQKQELETVSAKKASRFRAAFKILWKKLHTKILLIVTSIFLVLMLTISLVGTQVLFLRNTLDSMWGGPRRVLKSGDPLQYTYYAADYENKAETFAAANLFNELLVEEGIVLLKNEDNALPIPTQESGGFGRPSISVFGKNSVNLVYGGSGSGESSTDGAATIHESLTEAGYNVNSTLRNFYTNNSASGNGRPRSPDMGQIPAGFAIGETPIASYSSAVRNSYTSFNDAAVIVFSRIGGEGYDLPRSMKSTFGNNPTPISGARSMDDHYLQLDQNETNLIREVEAHFEKIIIVINASQAIEVGFLDDPSHYAYSPKIKAALWMGSPGLTGAMALGRVMNGSVNPSGRTVNTYARDFKAEPSWHNFANNNATDGNRYIDSSSGRARLFYQVEYEEGIYVGYRYWETRGFTEYEKDGNWDWYNDHVVYPIGHGLSYTSFDWEVQNRQEVEDTVIASDGKGSVAVEVKVTNTGTVPGKDVVQVYLTAPYTTGGIEKSHVVLAGFEKTPMLDPGAHETVKIDIPVLYFASYDYNNAAQSTNGFKGYKIESGDYALKVSKNANMADDTLTINVAAEIQIGNDPTTQTPIENRFDEVSDYITTYLSRADWAATWPEAPTVAERTKPTAFFNALEWNQNDAGAKWEAFTTPTQSRNTLSGRNTKVKLHDLIGKAHDDPLWDDLLNQLTVRQMSTLIGTGNYNTMAIDTIYKPRTLDPDGPVGFTTFMGDPSVYDTGFYASGCVVGATYNKELAEAMGIMVGNEGIIGNEKGDGTPYSGWYAPAVNIHRSPFSGRNWEYYSEDGFLSGVMAAAVIRGAMSKGVYTYVKHFALNDQETNRSTNGLLTWANEQSMREIYFRAFEITVKDGNTTAIMSAFNRIGTVWTGGSYELLTEILRDEWGFRGMVITDYNLYAHMPADQMIRAGGDLNLTQDKRPSVTDTPTQVTALRNATHNILYTVANSNAMNGYGEGVIYAYRMSAWMVWLIVVDALLIAALGVWAFFAIRKTYKKHKISLASEVISIDSIQVHDAEPEPDTLSSETPDVSPPLQEEPPPDFPETDTE
ncbi:MAG: glycoside hydrolase family 3 C-terminal domain-containing protein [Firmicutes bacterium]|nr:glycoside hydrolase family 3 C-terminal domain-containing protein [Bacillota bacterium]